jgi:hypothetical protein
MTGRRRGRRRRRAAGARGFAEMAVMQWTVATTTMRKTTTRVHRRSVCGWPGTT